ncbi:MAG: DNA repair protein RadA [Phycisphaerales bacterium]
MAKQRTQYLCRECGGVQPRWLGKCPDCNAWDSLEVFREARPSRAAASSFTQEMEEFSIIPKAQPLPEVEASHIARITCNMPEFDRVLGGGLVPGSAILLAGDPGIGKSTLLLQAAASLAEGPDHPAVLYVSSEESSFQTRLRAERLFEEGTRASSAVQSSRFESLFILADTNLARVLEQARQVQPLVMVVDSIQMLYRADVDAAPGSITQLRRCCFELVQFARASDAAVIMVGHVTKEGQIAGPKLLEHLVDAVFSFEGDRHHAYRVVRAVKNRFGTTEDVALFEMTAQGLRESPDGSFLYEASDQARPGSVVCPAMHGSRCLLVEVQALTTTGFLGNARRRSSGLDTNRLAMAIAVLEKHGGLRLADQDVFASTTGGLRLVEPGADLAMTLAIAGAHTGRALEHGWAVVGEVGLGGEVRRAASMEQRVREAARLGFRGVIVPRQSENELERVTTIEVCRVDSVSTAIDLLSAYKETVKK